MDWKRKLPWTKKAWGEANCLFLFTFTKKIFEKGESKKKKRTRVWSDFISRETEGEFYKFQRHKNQGRIIILFQQFQQGKQDVFQGRIYSFDGRFFQHVFRGDFCRFLKKKILKKKISICTAVWNPYSPYGTSRTARFSRQTVCRIFVGLFFWHVVREE